MPMTEPAKPQVLRFEEWYQENHRLFEDLKEVDCLKCDGFGVVDCGECGHETDCGACDGAGSVKTTEENRRLTASRYYDEQVKADLKKWDEWMQLAGRTL